MGLSIMAREPAMEGPHLAVIIASPVPDIHGQKMDIMEPK
jgi:hypothetical protein